MYVKFGCKSASGYELLGKTTQGHFLWNTLYITTQLFFSMSLYVSTIEHKRYWNRAFAYPMCRSVCWSVCLSVCLESVLWQNGWL